jgi:hypothetical protein
VSFCAAEEAIQWLHYGRSGSGIALEFESAKLRASGFHLAPVVYDETEQDRILLQLLEFTDWFVQNRVRVDSQDDLIRLSETVVEWAIAKLKWLAPTMKAAAFGAEKEWRLVLNDIGASEHHKPRAVRFRASAGRIIPYTEVDFPDMSIAGMVLGSSAPIAVNEQAIEILLESTLGTTVPVRRSSVQVRS